MTNKFYYFVLFDQKTRLPVVKLQATFLHQCYKFICIFTALTKPKQYDWKDSNLALFGSDTEKQVKSEYIDTRCLTGFEIVGIYKMSDCL